MKRLVLPLVMVITLAILPASGALAATSQNVTVTAIPGVVSISNAPSTWTINGITKSGVISANTTYYSNPLGDNITPSATVAAGECYFTVTNSSTVNITLTVNFGDFSGGDAMTNTNTGSATTTGFGASSYYDGMTYSSKVIAKSTGSDALIANVANTTASLKWGLEVKTRTDEWSSGDAQTSTVTITATSS